MKKSTKWVLISSIAASVFLTGVVFSQSSSADVDTEKVAKADRHQKLTQDEKAERSKLESMPANTEDEIKQQVQQGLKVKQLGLEAGKLQEELHPTDLRVRLEENLRSVKDILNSNKYYANMVNDPAHGEQYKKAYEILLQKIAIFDQIERDYKENNKSAEQLQTELDNLIKIKELQ